MYKFKLHKRLRPNKKTKEGCKKDNEMIKSQFNYVVLLIFKCLLLKCILQIYNESVVLL